jgi:hypothetical protein
MGGKDIGMARAITLKVSLVRFTTATPELGTALFMPDFRQFATETARSLRIAAGLRNSAALW